MKIKRYFAADMRQAIRMVRDEQGPDAVILSNRKVDGGIEVVAAVDYDEGVIRKLAAERTAPAAGSEQPRGQMAELPQAPLSEAMSPQAPTEAATAARTEQPVSPTPEPRVVWSQDPALVAMREEIQTLRSILEGQLSGLAWSEEGRRNPFRTRLLEQLTRLGLSPVVSRELADGVECGRDTQHNWRQALALLARRLPVTNDDILTHGGVVALVGPTGVGKTTTAAKLAARFTLRHGPNRVALVTTDSYRIGAHQQLKTFGRILGAPVHVAEDADELRRILALLSDRQLVIIDTAGMSQRDLRLSEQFAMLRGGSPMIRKYLVLSATTQRAGLEEGIRAFGHIGLDGCIVTKVDETMGLGEAISAIVQQQLPVAYLGDGQRVPEDLQPARANNLVNRSVALMRQHSEKPDEEALAFAFGGRVSNGNG